MAEIKQLSASVAALIAAGEVVERPASVVKELVENSIDALATHITVELRKGGISYIRVTDDGKGMSEEDVPNSFLRHATSKIETGDDLENIVTLGFRGEALYSIAAVSQVDLTTKRREDDWGTRAIVCGGNVAGIEPTGCPDGTTVIVKDLFFNTPARMKFLKKDSVESGYVEDIVRKISLARPDISFRFISNGKEIFFTPGDNELQNTVSALWGSEYADAMLPVEYTQDGVQISGLIGKSELNRPNRSFQIFFVNGRLVTHKSFSVALMEAYKGQIMAGRFPVCVLHINIDPVLCDVNVHPSKAEIKFANDKPIFDVIFWGTKNSLYAIRDTRFLRLENKPATETVYTEIKGEQEKILPPSPEVKEKTYIDAFMQNSNKSTKAEKHSDKEKTSYSIPEKKPEADFTYNMIKHDRPETVSAATPVSIKPFEEKPIEEKAPSTEEKTVPFVRIIGQLFNTYILAESDGKLLLVDQHAAHERIIYNSLLEGYSEKGVDSQMLLMPAHVMLSSGEMTVFSDNIEIISKLGFDAEEFGTGVVKISMIPSALVDCDISSTFLEILERLSMRRDLKTDAENHALHTVACKAAMKAGKVLSLKEQEVLVQKALLLEGIATCPHGRPIILSLTQKEVEKQFKRIV